MADVPTLITRIRLKLLEVSASFWSDAELLEHINAAASDLWRAICDNFQDYFFEVDDVTMAADATTLTSVPTNVAKIEGIEPADMERYPSIKFVPKKYTSAEFQAARARSAQDPSQAGVVYYAPTGAGAPVGAPTIYVAPKLSASLALKLIHTPTTPKLTNAVGQENPIPGESDDAIAAYAIAHALAKERDDKSPHPDWLAKYATEKTNILTFLTPRQNDEPDVAEGVHEVFIDG